MKSSLNVQIKPQSPMVVSVRMVASCVDLDRVHIVNYSAVPCYHPGFDQHA